MDAARWIDYWVVDVFTEEPFRGNPAGVVLDAGGLAGETMRLIAREMGSTETVFAFPCDKKGFDLCLRWFTATCEVPFSGHATLAALHVLAETGRHSSTAPVTLDTLAGPLKGWPATSTGQGFPRVEVPLPYLEPAPFGLERLTPALLVPADALAPDLPLLREGLSLLVPFANQQALLNLRPDFRQLSRLGLEHDITAFVCFARKAAGQGAHWYLRLFAPGIGISEDPVSGSAHAAACTYLLAQEVLSTPQAKEGIWTGSQGDNLDRHGQVQVEVTFDDQGQPTRVRISGPAITTMQGRLRVA